MTAKLVGSKTPLTVLEAQKIEREHQEKKYLEELRDKFALSALSGMLTIYGEYATVKNCEEVWKWADYMLSTRKRRVYTPREMQIILLNQWAKQAQEEEKE